MTFHVIRVFAMRCYSQCVIRVFAMRCSQGDSQEDSRTLKTLQCCRCNDKGLCSRCQCVKNNTPCVNCLPLRRGHCRNAPDLTQATKLTSNLPLTQLNSGSSVNTPIRVNPTLEASISSLTTSLPPFGTLHTDYAVDYLSRLDRTPADPFSLPLSTSVAEPNFIWGVLEASSFRKIIH